MTDTYEGKIFCISFQRTGTTSVGNFFKHFGFKVAGWPICNKNSWSKSWFDGDFESVFQSIDFIENQVFEDSPWWHPNFYKVLYHRFPNAKFILFSRNSNEWFDSMISHSNGMTMGILEIHCSIYRREKEYYENKSNISLELRDMEEHYKSVYELHNKQVIDFFKAKQESSLLICNLNDETKWIRLGKFVGIDVPINFDIHSNKSVKPKGDFYKKTR